MIYQCKKVILFSFFIMAFCFANSGSILDEASSLNVQSTQSLMLTPPTIVIDHVGLNTVDTLPDYIPPYTEVLVDVLVNGGVDEDDIEPGGVVLNWQENSLSAPVYMRAMPRLYNLLYQNYHYIKRIDPYGNGNKIYWWVTALNTGGEQSSTEIDSFVIGTLSIDDSILPERISLKGNFPNPFNPSTQIYFHALERSQIDLKIFSLNGDLIKSYPAKYFDIGTNFIEWNGLNDKYNSVPSGVYVYKIKSMNQIMFGKMTLLK